MKRTISRISIPVIALLCATIGFSINSVAQIGGIPELMYFKFDTVIAGAVPNDANPATRVGTATAPIVGGHTVGSSGQFGKGFVGSLGSSSTDYLNTGWLTNLTGSWTISLWLNIPNPPTTRYYFGDNSAGSFRCFTGGAASTGLRLTGPFTVTTSTIQPAPHVVHYVYDAGTSTLQSYIDGVADVSITTTATMVATTGPFKVGAYGTGNSFEGVIDEFRMYNRALTAAEVALTWNVPLPFSPCPSVTGLTSINITNGSADIIWDTVGGITGYEYVISTSATPPASGTPTTDTFQLATGLSPATTYYAHIRVNCGSAFSNWTTTSFMTDACQGTFASVTNIRPNDAQLNWLAVSGVVGYEYAVTTSATPPASGTSTTGTTQLVTGLSAETQHYAHVRTDCGVGFSAWITEPFVTDTCRAPMATLTTVTPNSADFTWNNPLGATGYEFAVNGFATPPLSGTTTTAISHSEPGLTPATAYHFHLRTGCEMDSSDWVSTNFTTNPLGIESLSQSGFNLSVYPNPFSSRISIALSKAGSGERSIEISDYNGKVVRLISVTTNDVDIDLSDLNTGIYLLRYRDNDNDETLRITKQ